MLNRKLPERRRKHCKSQEVGLRIFSVIGRYFFKTEHLHYGYWPADLPVTLENVATAQDLYSEFLCSHIPPGTRTILDVGCGSGHNAQLLLSLGYEVDCVSPSPYLSELARSKVRERGQLFECFFEELPAGKRYDCLLFSESFQYIDLEVLFARMPEFLVPGGHVVVMDFFRIPGEGKSAMGGGHRLNRFQEQLADSGFTLTREEDITDRTAPNLQLVDEFLQQFALPVRDILLAEADCNYHYTFRVGRWFSRIFFREKLDKLNYKYFSGRRNAENFKSHKRYYLFVLKLTAREPALIAEPAYSEQEPEKAPRLIAAVSGD